MQFVCGQLLKDCGWQGAHTGSGVMGPQGRMANRVCCCQLLDVSTPQIDKETLPGLLEHKGDAAGGIHCFNYKITIVFLHIFTVKC